MMSYQTPQQEPTRPLSTATPLPKSYSTLRAVTSTPYYTSAKVYTLSRPYLRRLSQRLSSLTRTHSHMRITTHNPNHQHSKRIRMEITSTTTTDRSTLNDTHHTPPSPPPSSHTPKLPSYNNLKNPTHPTNHRTIPPDPPPLISWSQNVLYSGVPPLQPPKSPHTHHLPSIIARQTSLAVPPLPATPLLCPKINTTTHIRQKPNLIAS